MRQTLSEAGFANIFANFLGQGLERLVDPDDASVYGVGNLPLPLMEAACNNLRIRADFQSAYVLHPQAPGPLHITPEQLAERVAADPDAHLVVFVPDEFLRDAEQVLTPDFFTPVDMFTSLENMEGQLIQKINRVPVYKRIATLWSQHAAERLPILKRIDYLINVISLCLGPEEMGMFFHKLDLIPDLNPDVTGNFGDRLARNLLSATILCDRQLPPRARVDALRLHDEALKARLTALLESPELTSPTPEGIASAIFQHQTDNPDAGLTFDRWRFLEESGWS
ncbi:MAG: hypothetical protein OEY97_00585 [Nitrospirota bacterium]|nr:hypothetical protein [Nitrospirota bacterium]